MKFSQFILLVLCSTFFSLNAWSYNLPSVVAEKTIEPGSGNQATLNVTFKVYGSTAYPINNLNYITIVAEITSENSEFQLQEWSPANSGNASVQPHWDRRIATISGYIHQVGSRLDGMPEAQIMIVAGADQNLCGHYGVRILSASIEYVNGKYDNGTVTPVTHDDISQTGNCGGGSNRIGNFDAPAPSELKSSLYPNPTQGHFFLSAPSNSRIQVSNLAGQLVYESRTSQEKEQIATTDWPTGVYLVRIYDEDKKKTEVLKLSVL